MEFLDDPWRLGPLVIGDPGAVVFGLFISSMGLLLLVIGIREIRRSRASRSWPTARARVLSSRVRARIHPRRATTYAPEIEYVYEVEGREYTSTMVAAGETEFAFESDAARFAQQYQEGAQVTVHYAPGKPGTSVLEPGFVTWGRTALRLLMGGVVACMGLPFVVFGFTEDTSSTEPRRVPTTDTPLLESGVFGYLAFGLFLVGSGALFLWESRQKDRRSPWVPSVVIASLVCVGMILIQLAGTAPFPSRDALILMGVGLFELLTLWLRRAGESSTRGNP